MMTTFNRSYHNDEEVRRAAEAWADDLLEIEPEYLQACFKAAKSRHASLADESIRFPLVASEVLFCWREKLAARRLQELALQKDVCLVCHGAREFISYDPVKKQDIKLRCPYHE